LAVAAHFCVADVIGVNSKSSKGDLVVVRDAAVLLAQADLIVVWLVLGGSSWIRRLPWSLCGLTGVGLVLYMHNFSRVMGFVLAAYAAHLTIAAATIGWLRFRGSRIIRNAGNSITAAGLVGQFTIADLFGAALATAIAVSWMLRMEPPGAIDGAGVLQMLLVSAPMVALTLVAVLGMTREHWLVVQMVIAALVAVLLAMPPHVIEKQLGLPYTLHWLLVAFTLWVFQMCGYRLEQPQSHAAMGTTG
jgi:hypothetical protein